MTVIAAALAVALVMVVFLALRHIQTLEAKHVEERRELLNRIQRPEVIPVAAAPNFQVPEQEPDEWGMVGTVVIDPDYGLEE